jgi:uncharacterized protein (TIGR02145 family)
VKKILILFILLAGCGGTQKAPVEQPKEAIVRNSTAELGTFRDTRDGKTYKTTKIGEQVWMAENLNYEVDGSVCYDSKPENCQKYGSLYDWETAKKVCPNDWHLPSNAEWDKLYRFADGTSGTESPYISKTAGKHLKAKSGWDNYEGKLGNGMDTFGFAALPGGGKDDDSFNTIGNSGFWWSSSIENLSSNAYSRVMTNGTEYAVWIKGGNSFLYSVRCVGD